MTNKVRTHITDASPDDQEPTAKSLTKQQFGKRLYKFMVRNSWSQADLSRHSGLPRDRISTYVRGKTLPTPQNTLKLAEALGISPHELLPNFLPDYAEIAVVEGAPSFEMKVSPNAPNTAWIRVNRLVTLQTALKIGEILNSDDASGSGSGGASSV